MTTLRSAIAASIGAVALGASLAVGVAPAQAVEPAPVVQAPCSITSKVITLGHDRWMVKARLYRADKRYPRHTLTLNKIGSDGTVTPLATSVGNKKAKWNWRMTGVLVAGETLQVQYAGDASTLTCEGAVLTPQLRPRR
jgi:hypothetical protein